jgi:ribose/xylose/arabinose/galactoside ABC-type transport system permease subunit/ABC-type branched-subunit amino acid transport system ATPase component
VSRAVPRPSSRDPRDGFGRRAAYGTLGWSKRNALFFALAGLVVYFSFASSHFLSGSNIEVILLNSAILGIVAVPGAMLVLAGYVDLSVGSAAVLCAVVFGKLFESGLPPGLCFVLAILCGTLWGVIQGVLVTRFGLSPIVVSLGGLAGLRGLALWISDAFVAQGFGDGISTLGNGSLIGIPIPVWIFFASFGLGGYVWFRTPWGRHFTAIGADASAAHALGIDTRRLPLVLYAASGTAAGLGGLILMAQLDAASLSIGEGLELSVLTAILLGGVAFVGGRGSLFGVLMGVLFIGVLENGLLLVNVSAYLVPVAIGTALVLAAGLDVLYQRLDRVPLTREGPAPHAAATGIVELAEMGPPDGMVARPPVDPGGAPLLEVRGLGKTFGAVRALHDVSFDLRPGEVVGLVGDNGAGKSTLVTLLAGVAPPDAGTIHLDGVAHAFATPGEARAAGIETVFQGLALIPSLDIAENVFLNRELFKGWPLARQLRWMDKSRMRMRSVESFERLNLTLPGPGTKVAGLSGGQRQAIAIGRTVLWGSRIVILDEPAAALGVRQTEIVLQFVEQLRAHGIAVVFISHNMQHVLRVADRVLVMRLGEKVFDGRRADVTGEDLVALMTGARLVQPAGEEVPR